MKKRYYIKDLEQILKVGRTLIYYWEATNKIPKGKRTPMGNYRYWNVKEIKQIQNKLKGEM